MAERKEWEQFRYAKELEACYQHGRINEKEYNLVKKAMANEAFSVVYKKLQGKGNSISIEWEITLVKHYSDTV